MTNYLIDALGILSGPVEALEIPGLGKQLPSNAVTLSEPLPAPLAGCVWVWGAEGPRQMEDHRGRVYRTDSGVAEKYDQLGPLPPELTLLPRPSSAYAWANGGWVKDLAFAHRQQVSRVNADCMAEIIGGFWSSALGSAYQYSSELDDQLNLTGVILRGEESPYACRDEQGQKAFLLHSAPQLRQVGDDFTLFKLQLLQKANRLKQQLDQALSDGDVAALEALSWEDPQA
jgi:hypothetical protein